jgi:hypothetical protein
VVADAALAPFFAGTNMGRRRGHLAGFVAEATGGPAYRGCELGAAHAHLGIRRRGPEPILKVGLWRDPLRRGCEWASLVGRASAASTVRRSLE